MANIHLSPMGNVTCGVPQGSILGPLLYSVYINDMNKLNLKAKIKMYADDTVIYTQNSNHMSANISRTHEFTAGLREAT